MANKIGEVLEIKPEDSYIKKPAGPMITMETHDIGKLTGYIHIPSMVEGATVKDTTLQESYTQASQINAKNAANLSILPKPA